MAERLGRYYLTTTLKDPFQFYQAEPVIILDELRPETIPYSEILAMFDPFSYGNVRMSSRYHNKALACRVFFVTSPYNPVAFYAGTNKGKSSIDAPEQFYRRLTSVLHMTEDYIYRMEYNPILREYIIKDAKENRYSKKNHNQIVTSNLFDEID